MTYETPLRHHHNRDSEAQKQAVMKERRAMLKIWMDVDCQSLQKCAVEQQKQAGTASLSGLKRFLPTLLVKLGRHTFTLCFT